jgi:uncharacterized membrane protein
MKQNSILALAVCLSMPFAARPAQAAHYLFASFSAPNSVSMNMPSINDAGTIAGSYTDVNHQSAAYVLQGGTYTLMSPPKGTTLIAVTALNASNVAVGFYDLVVAKQLSVHAFMWSKGVFTTLSVPGRDNSTANAITDSGQILLSGYTETRKGKYKFLSGIYQNGSFTALPTNAKGAALIDGSGTVYGDYGPKLAAFSERGDHRRQLQIGGSNLGIVPVAVQGNGKVTGYFDNADGITEGFIYFHHKSQVITAAGDTDIYPEAIAARGTVVGQTYSSRAGTHGFVYRDGKLRQLDVPGGSVTRPSSINTASVIVGSYTDASQNPVCFIATPSGAD